LPAAFSVGCLRRSHILECIEAKSLNLAHNVNDGRVFNRQPTTREAQSTDNAEGNQRRRQQNDAEGISTTA
jgi:hypothetical protein